MRIIHGKYFYLLIYALISLAILVPFLLPGAIFTLDMRLGPNLDLTPHLYGLHENAEAIIRLPVYSLLWLFNKVAPFWLWQKVLFFFIFFLAGVGAHRLFPIRGAASYFAGLLYMINPFTYVRFLAGQWIVLAFYALTPFAIKAFIDLLEARNKRNAVKVAVFSTLVGLTYVHGLLLLCLAFFIILAVRLLTLRRKTMIIDTVRFVGISAAIFIALNIYWLIPILAAKGTMIEQIGRQDLFCFAPIPVSNPGVMFDTASMYGFWRGGYIYTKDILPAWWLLFVFILYLAVFGYISSRRDKETGWPASSFLFLWIVSLVLAVGAASYLTRPLFEWLWEHFPFFRAFRDSHKFVALLCLAYAYLGGLGVNEFLNNLRQQRKKLAKAGMAVLVVLAFLTPLTYSFAIFGFHGQLKATDYPEEWYEVKEYLNQDKADFFVLFLPWHEFMDYSWLPNRDKRLGNPARAFFDKPIVQGDNIEMPGVYSQSTNPISKYIEFLLSHGNEVNNLGELLAPLNVKYVILVNEADYHAYNFLHRQEDMRVELEKPGITLFRNRHPAARVYGVSSVVYVNNLEEYLELSQNQNVMEHLYIIKSSPSEYSFPEGLRSSELPSKVSIDYMEKSPVKYQVEGTPHSFTIFTVPQHITTGYWEYNGKKPVKNLGFMPAFASSSDGGDIVYARFYRIYLPGYIISLMAIAFTAWYYFWRKHS